MSRDEFESVFSDLGSALEWRQELKEKSDPDPKEIEEVYHEYNLSKLDRNEVSSEVILSLIPSLTPHLRPGASLGLPFNHNPPTHPPTHQPSSSGNRPHNRRGEVCHPC